MKRCIAPLFAALAALLPNALPARAGEPSAVTGPQVGSPAPDFALTTLDGKAISLASFRGKTLVVNVWATWCPPCRMEMPELIETAKELQKSNVAVLGVDTTEEAPIVRAYVAAKNVTYPQAIDGTKAFADAFDVQYFPSTYVIDPQGILRARYVDVIAPPQLRALVAAANAGRNGVIASPLQTKIDAALANSQFSFTGDSASVESNAQSVSKAIAKAESLLDDSDAAKGNSTDLIRTRAEEATIRDRAIAALAQLSAPPTDKTLLPMLRGGAASDRESWQAALDAYQQVATLDPKNSDALGGIALAASRLKNYPLVIDADTKLAALDPKDAGALIDLGRAQAAAGQLPDSYATFDKAVTVATAALDADPKSAKKLRMLAFVHLYYGRTYAKAGDVAHAREQFDTLVALATKLPASDIRHDMYLEEGQEALVALRLGGGSASGATVSLAPWTGAELPGSIPNTIKYRVAIAGDIGKTVTLKAFDVPKGWIASFCSDRVCSPFRVQVAIPDSGVKIVEFQLVPPNGKAPAPKVRVTGSGDGQDSTATT